MRAAYEALHARGWAHSVEVWLEDRLVGGLYGIAIGRAFFGESMFSRATNASKAAMLSLCLHLAEFGGGMLDCQVVSPHLLTVGAKTIPRAEFRVRLATSCGDGRRMTGWPEGRFATPSGFR